MTPRYAPQPAGVDWPTRAWPRAAGHAALEDVVDEAFTASDLAITQAVVVVRAGAVVAERYGGEVPFFDRPAEPVTPDTRLLSWSMAKSMLHFAIGTLVDDARLDPGEAAPVPEWSGDDDPRGDIRVADMLAMRDGLAWNEDYEIGQPSDVIEMLFGEGQDDVARYAAARPARASDPARSSTTRAAPATCSAASSPTSWATATTTARSSTGGSSRPSG